VPVNRYDYDEVVKLRRFKDTVSTLFLRFCFNLESPLRRLQAALAVIGLSHQGKQFENS